METTAPTRAGAPAPPTRPSGVPATSATGQATFAEPPYYRAICPLLKATVAFRLDLI